MLYYLWHDTACHLRTAFLLAAQINLLLLDLTRLLVLFGSQTPAGVSGQLSLWADRTLIVRIIESTPSSGKSLESPRCPRPRSDVYRQIPEKLFLILNGLLLEEVREKISLSAHNPIPPRIDVLRAKWKADVELVYYNIQLKSMNPKTLHTPLLNIAPSGYVPSIQSELRITLPCTGNVSGIAPFHVQLDIRREFEALRRIPRISFMVYKHCLSAEKQTQFIIKCECRAQCSQQFKGPNRRNLRKRCIRKCQRHYNSASLSKTGAIL